MSGHEAARDLGSTPILPRLGVRFAISYLTLAGVLFSIYGFPFELFGARADWLSGYLSAYARLAGGVLHWFDRAVVVTGSRIDGRFSLQIVRNCDAIEINILFASAVLAFPAPFKRRVLGALVGLALLVGANVLRICVLYYLGVEHPAWFEPAHEELLPLLLVGLAALIFLGFARSAQLERASTRADGARSGAACEPL